ncbi:TPA: hypothetical protein ACH7RP_003925 [Escherichia coli]
MNAVKMIQKENQLELPLFFLDEEPKTAEVIPFEPKPEWTDDEVRQLRDGLLWHSLRVLADGRAGSEIKQETMAWVMSDEVHPFSFVVCCDEAGYDPSGVRTMQTMQKYRTFHCSSRTAGVVSHLYTDRTLSSERDTRGTHPRSVGHYCPPDSRAIGSLSRVRGFSPRIREQPVELGWNDANHGRSRG